MAFGSVDEWKQVVGWEGWYEVSSSGKVKRLAKTRGTRPGFHLKPGKSKFGHLYVNLYRHGKGKTEYIHTLVLTAFVGPCPPGLECRHLDGNPRNNNLDNLCWGTHAENMADSVRHGTSKIRKRGEARANSKLTEESARALKARLHTESQRKLAREFNVSRSAVQSIVRGRSWFWVT